MNSTKNHSVTSQKASLEKLKVNVVDNRRISIRSEHSNENARENMVSPCVVSTEPNCFFLTLPTDSKKLVQFILAQNVEQIVELKQEKVKSLAMNSGGVKGSKYNIFHRFVYTLRDLYWQIEFCYCLRPKLGGGNDDTNQYKLILHELNFVIEDDDWSSQGSTGSVSSYSTASNSPSKSSSSMTCRSVVQNDYCEDQENKSLLRNS